MKILRVVPHAHHSWSADSFRRWIPQRNLARAHPEKARVDRVLARKPVGETVDHLEEAVDGVAGEASPLLLGERVLELEGVQLRFSTPPERYQSIFCWYHGSSAGGGPSPSARAATHGAARGPDGDRAGVGLWPLPRRAQQEQQQRLGEGATFGGRPGLR